ncbi:MAG TPA: MazG family protein [Chloroflexota bacterium]|nr:MazG family protein [Chloroflexota bacterium]
MSQITIVGLGPGSPDLLTAEAINVLQHATVLYVERKTPAILAAVAERVPVVVLGPPRPGAAEVLDREALAVRVVELGQRGAVTYGVAGSPLSDDPISRAIRAAGRRAKLSVEIVDGVSYLDFVIRLLDLDVFDDTLQVVEAGRLIGATGTSSEAGTPNPFLGVYRAVDPTRPVLVRDVFPAGVPATRGALGELYPPDYPVAVVRLDAGSRASPVVVPLRELAASGTVSGRACLYLRPRERLADVAAFDTLRYIVARLRGPGGCPWDREQTFQSVKKHLLEETYEAVAALDADEYAKFAEELGDVLLQVVMYAQFGREAGRFNLEDVLRAVNEKLVRRHPHVFGDVAVGSSAEVLRNWEKIKQAEKQGSPAEAASTFAGIPQAAPALMRAEAVQSRATRHGWEPPTTPPDLSDLLPADLTLAERLDRLGDALFDLVALARRYKLDPEEALRLATNRFVKKQSPLPEGEGVSALPVVTE